MFDGTIAGTGNYLAANATRKATFMLVPTDAQTVTWFKSSWIAALFFKPLPLLNGGTPDRPCAANTEQTVAAYQEVRDRGFSREAESEVPAIVSDAIDLGIYEVAALVRMEGHQHPGDAAYDALQNREIAWPDKGERGGTVVTVTDFPRSMTTSDIAVLPDGRWLFCLAHGWSLHPACPAIGSLIQNAACNPFLTERNTMSRETWLRSRPQRQ